jgi:hypothetical protein
VRGTISVDWRKTQRSFDLKVSIPAGMEAKIAVPTIGSFTPRITESGTIVWNSNAYVSGIAGVYGATSETDSIVFRAGSGNYHFILSGASD